MHFSINRPDGICFWWLFFVRNEYYSDAAWFSVIDDFGNLLKVEPSRTVFSLETHAGEVR